MGNSSMERNRDTAFMNGPMALCTTVNGTTIQSMVMVITRAKMGVSSRECGGKLLSMDVGSIPGPMAAHFKGSIQRTRSMALESSRGGMAGASKASGTRANSMASASRTSQMGQL